MFYIKIITVPFLESVETLTMGEVQDFLNVKQGGTPSYHCDSKGHYALCTN
jgi:hypothetical protein